MTVPHIDVEIVPALPTLEVSLLRLARTKGFAIFFIIIIKFLQVETNKPKSDIFSSFSDSVVTSASVSLLMGESQECCITLTNTGKVPIESLELSLDARLDKKAPDIFTWSEENILSQLPIAPGASASLTVYMYGIGDFIGQPDFHAAAETSSVSSLPATNNTPEGPASLPSRLGAISDRLRAKRTESSASNRFCEFAKQYLLNHQQSYLMKRSITGQVALKAIAVLDLGRIPFGLRRQPRPLLRLYKDCFSISLFLSASSSE